MAAPQVRELQTLIKTLSKGVAPQKALIDTDIAANAASGVAQETGLKATEDKSYRQIEQNAQDKGMFFSGFSPDEQATYNSTTYLPALAQLQATIAQTRSQLLGKKADLDTGVFNKAFDAREGDVSFKRDWEKMTAQQKFEAQQSALDRDFKAKESARDRAAAAANAARAAAGGSRTTAAEALDTDRKALAGELFQVTGRDGFVSPESYAKAKNAWVGSGYAGKTFDSYFATFRNPQNKYYKLSK